MRKYRIKQIGENKFIPQVRKHFCGSWYGIDKNYNCKYYLYEWTNNEYQIKYCLTESYNEAVDVIYNHNYKSNKKTEYPKFHKVNI